MKLRRLREGDVLDGDVILVRGGELDPDVLRTDEPTGRNPRHYTIGFDHLDKGVRRLTDCQHQILPNPYHDA